MDKNTKTKIRKPMGRPKGKPRTAAEIAADAKRTGRPGMTPEANATKTVAMRLTPSEFEQFRRDGEKRGMGLAAFSRHCWNIAKGLHYGDDIQDTEKRGESGHRKTGTRRRQ
jgi:hypothetical protein